MACSALRKEGGLITHSELNRRQALSFVCSLRYVRTMDIALFLGCSDVAAHFTVVDLLNLGYIQKCKQDKKDKSIQSITSTVYTFTTNGYVANLVLNNNPAFSVEEKNRELLGFGVGVDYLAKLNGVLKSGAFAFVSKGGCECIEKENENTIYFPEELKQYSKLRKNTRADNGILLFNDCDTSVKARNSLSETKTKNKFGPNNELLFEDKFFIADIRPHIVTELRRLYQYCKCTNNLSINYPYEKYESPYSTYIPIKYYPLTHSSSEWNKNTNKKPISDFMDIEGRGDLKKDKTKQNPLEKHFNECVAWYPNVPNAIYEEDAERLIRDKCEAERKGNCEAYKAKYEALEKNHEPLSNKNEEIKPLVNVREYTYDSECNEYKIPVVLKRLSEYEYRKFRKKYKAKLFKMQSGKETEEDYVKRVYKSAERVWEKELKEKVALLLSKKREDKNKSVFLPNELYYVKHYIQKNSDFVVERYEKYLDNNYEVKEDFVMECEENCNNRYFSQDEINRLERVTRKIGKSDLFERETSGYHARGYWYYNGEIYTIYNFGKKAARHRNDAEKLRNRSVTEDFFGNLTTLECNNSGGAIVLMHNDEYLTSVLKEMSFDERRFDRKRKYLVTTGVVQIACDCKEHEIFVFPESNDGANVFNLIFNHEDRLQELIDSYYAEESDRNEFLFVDEKGRYVLSLLDCSLSSYRHLSNVVDRDTIYKRPIAIYYWKFQKDFVETMINKKAIADDRFYELVSFDSSNRKKFVLNEKKELPEVTVNLKGEVIWDDKKYIEMEDIFKQPKYSDDMFDMPLYDSVFDNSYPEPEDWEEEHEEYEPYNKEDDNLPI